MYAARDWELWTCQARLVTTPDALPAATVIADRMLAEVEEACSRFRDDSELRRLAAGWNDVSPALADLIQEALTGAWLSQGAVDPTLGSVLNALGYDRSRREPSASRRADGSGRATTLRVIPSLPGWRAVKLDRQRVFRPEHVQLDLGATAKAVAADRVADRIAAELEVPVLVSLGGDIATAGQTPEGGWQVVVQDLPGDVPVQVTLADGAAVATSSTAKRTWSDQGTPRHHLIDPATGLPTTGPWRTVSVVAETCARANTAATGTIVKGRAGLAWLRSLGLPARLIDDHGVVHHLGGFPRDLTSPPRPQEMAL